MLKLLALLISHSALAGPPVIWNGANVKWLNSGNQAAGICKTDASGVQTPYTTDGIVKMSSGVPGAAASGTDYAPATSGSAVLKGNGSGGFSSAVSGTDYAPATSGSAILKGNGAGGFASASSGTDYQAPISSTTPVSHQFLTGFTAPNTFAQAQPAFTDVSGTAAVTQGGTGTGTQFTQGSAVFAGASGVYSQDNANYFWDATNHRLGIGTASPGYDLDIEAQTGVSAQFFMSRRADHHGWLFSVTTSPYLTLNADNGYHTAMQVQPTGIWNFDRGSENSNASTYTFGHSYDETSSNVLMTLWGTSASYTGDLFRWYDATATPALKGHIDNAGKFFANGGVQISTFGAAGVVTNDASGNLATVAPSTSGNVLTSNGSAWVSSPAAGGGCAAPVLTKTTDYTIVTGDFTCANKVLNVEANCSSACAMTFPAASNSGYEVRLINVGTATVTATLAGSDTFGTTADQTWILPAGGSPQSSNTFWANGGSRWNGM